jgi:hypothetical protein
MKESIPMDDRSDSIVAQTATKAAATLFAGTQDVVGMIAAAAEINADIVARTSHFKTAPAVPTPAPAIAAPPVQVAPVQQVAVSPVAVLAQAGLATTPVAPAVAPQGDDALWADLVANPTNWWNNTGDGDTTISGGNRPDFKHKDLKTPDKTGTPRPVALFLVSRRFNKTAPDAVFVAFGLAKPDLSQPAIPAATTPLPQSAPF